MLRGGEKIGVAARRLTYDHCEEVFFRAEEGRTLSRNNHLDHIFVYRRDQNLPYKFGDI